MAVSLIHPFLMIGEGNDEKACFTALLGFLRLTDVQVEEYAGKQELSSYLRDLPGFTGFRASTARGERPQDRRYTVPQVLSTLYRAMGIDSATTFPNGTGRPVYIVDDREPVRELV